MLKSKIKTKRRLMCCIRHHANKSCKSSSAAAAGGCETAQCVPTIYVYNIPPPNDYYTGVCVLDFCIFTQCTRHYIRIHRSDRFCVADQTDCVVYYYDTWNNVYISNIYIYIKTLILFCIACEYHIVIKLYNNNVHEINRYLYVIVIQYLVEYICINYNDIIILMIHNCSGCGLWGWSIGIILGMKVRFYWHFVRNQSIINTATF